MLHAMTSDSKRKTAESGPNASSSLQRKHHSRLATLQQIHGNQAVLRMLAKGDARHPHRQEGGRALAGSSAMSPRSAPRIRVNRATPWAMTSPRAVASDKSTSRIREKQDQSVNLDSFTEYNTGSKMGVDVHAVVDGGTSSPDHPDGLRWTQTVTTNDPGWTPVGAPLVSPPTSYVDPKPNDDTKPFYWTDAEEITHGGDFSDHPGRPPNSAGTIVWDAILSINGVKGTTVTRLDSVTYGFSVSPKGILSSNAPATPANVAGHTRLLKSSFPGWTFT
jgi:hypothetical protein